MHVGVIDLYAIQLYVLQLHVLQLHVTQLHLALLRALLLQALLPQALDMLCVLLLLSVCIYTLYACTHTCGCMHACTFSVVTDSKEWRFLKDKYNIRTPLEENMFLSVNQFQQSSSTNTGITSSGDTTSRRNPDNGTTTTTTT
eukprot:scpid109879/ scgid11000/ 